MGGGGGGCRGRRHSHSGSRDRGEGPMARGGAGARPTFAELNPASVRAPVRSGGKYKYHWNACALSEAWKGEGCGRACKNSGFGAALAPEQLSRCLPAAQVPILVGESERVVFWERNKKEKETAAKGRGKKGEWAELFSWLGNANFCCCPPHHHLHQQQQQQGPLDPEL